MANVLNFNNKVVFLGGLPLTLPAAASDPGSAVGGDIYFNTGSNKLRVYDGSTWSDVASGTVSLTGQSLNEQNIIVGNGSNSSAAVDTSAAGDILADSSDGLTIKSGAIVNAQISSSAAIAYSKLSLTTSIVNGDISASAAIVYSKLNLGNSIVNADISSSAAIAYSKLNLATSILNADISASAAIAYSKLSLSASIVNADIASAAAIALNKLAAVTASRVLVSDGSGFVSASSVTTTTLGYLDATSSIQTQLDGKLDLTGGTMSGDIDMGGNKVTGLGDPTSAGDAANKSYVDSVAEGLRPKESVRAATTANITLSGAQTIDGVSVVAGDRVLVKDQSSDADNGIYVADASTWSRAPDMDSLSPIDEVKGSYVPVREGTANAGKLYVCVSDPATLGTDPIDFVYFNSVSGLVGGDGITVSGSNISLNYDTAAFSASPTLSLKTDDVTIEVDPTNGVQLKSAGITDTQISLTAGIAYGKLSLTDGIVNADINASAGIEYSKLDLSSSVVDADISAAAGIDRSKIATGSAGYVVYNDNSTGQLSEEQYLAGNRGGFGADVSSFNGVIKAASGIFSAATIVDADVSASASIAFSKINSGAIDADLIPDTDGTRALGSGSKGWTEVWSPSLRSSGDVAINANSGDNNVTIEAAVVRISADGTNWLEEQYIDAVTLVANTTTTVTTYAGADFEGAHLEYKIKQNSTGIVRVGKIYLASQGTSSTSITDQFTETGDCEIAISADINSGNVRVRAANSDATNDSIMRVALKRFRA